MNQSIIDRMSLVQDIELPDPEVMVQRAMSVTGATDEYQVSKMVQVVSDMAEYCRKNSITDGAVGMRSLLDWIGARVQRRSGEGVQGKLAFPLCSPALPHFAAQWG